ncbi:transposase [uncultured Thiodictyon sp.]|uniref:transposase n=1 Tax=uncultured Thiodictyon sp. TaxID=1846217 RepID=UPI0026009586|nr:transposase [uncultured Thiodictyon sp.]
MTRPLRIALASGLYHVTSRGDRREAIYRDDMDRVDWLTALGATCERFNWRCHGYCEMTNHYHVVVETPDANLSQGMRQLNGIYTQQFNHCHRLVGHLFQGRFKAILVERETYLLELARYVVLNPVRAGVVAYAADWPWSSYRAMVGLASAPTWLETDWVLGQFGSDRRQARSDYATFVAAGVDQPSIWDGLRHQVFLGSDAFIAQAASAGAPSGTLHEVSRAQRRPLAKSLADFERTYPLRREAMARAFLTGAYTMQEIAEHFGIHYSTVSRAVQWAEEGGLSASTRPSTPLPPTA